MHAYVFTDARLAKRAGQFAWLSIDIDNPRNAAFVKKFPTQGVPTFLVIDPVSETAVQAWYGTISAPQLERWLDDGARALSGAARDPAEAALRRADRLNAERKPAEAVAAYREAITKGGADWSRYSRALESMMLTFELGSGSVTPADCVAATLEYAPRMPRGQSFVNVMRVGIKCAASEARAVAPAGGASPAQEHLNVLRPLAEAAVKIKDGFGDDQGEIFTTLVEIANRSGDTAAAKRYATEMWAFLEEQGRQAPNAEARASLDNWRVAAARYLNDPALLLPALEASDRDLPGDYNPPARLMSTYMQLNRLDDALAANQRALDRADGPRRVSYYRTRASIFEKKGDRVAAKKTLEDAIAYAQTLPPPDGPNAVAALRKQLEPYARLEPGK